MDKEKAKWLLASYRPDGADADDPMFREALDLALKDRELGEWLANERSLDAAFASGLSAVGVEEHLRENLNRIMLGDAPEQDAELAGIDHEMMAGLSAITVPSDLRDRILVSAGKPEIEESAWSWQRIRSVTAIAACLALGIWLVFGLQSESENGGISTLAAAEVVKAYAPPASLDFESGDLSEIQAYLAESDAAVPHMVCDGLCELELMGCAQLAIHERDASLICFRVPETGEMLHLLIFAKDSLHGDLPAMGDPRIETGNQIASASWRCPKCDYLLIAQDMDEERISELLA